MDPSEIARVPDLEKTCVVVSCLRAQGIQATCPDSSPVAGVPPAGFVDAIRVMAPYTHAVEAEELLAHAKGGDR
jgi:hypothetical protein